MSLRRTVPYAALCRVPIALFSAGSAVTGLLLVSPAFTWRTVLLGAGVFVLACGASALNQCQERDIDARMERTNHRPLPAGTLDSRRALVFGAALAASGLVLLLPLGPTSLFLGLLSLLWYNGVYTPLKRKTAFASVWGAPIGMLPPAIGWSSGNGDLTDPRLLAIAAFFFLWQVPHFWLLLLKSGDDYEHAGLPAITRLISRERLAAVTAVWFAAAAAVAMAFPFFGMVRAPFLFPCLLLSALGMAGTSAVAALRSRFVPAAFASANTFLLLLLCLLSADAIVRGAL